MSDVEFEGDSDQEVSENHSKLLEAVTELDKGKRVTKPERNEPSLEVSEFHLVKSGIRGGNAVHLRELAKALGQRATHAEIATKLRATQRKSTTLPKPLEKPAAARIKRAVGFENIKKDLGKWDAIVSKNRTAEQLHFPLKQTDMKLETSNEFLKRFRVQSELEIALAALEPVRENKKEEQENEVPLSLEQIIERRRDSARFRAQQSYREAKAYRQNKIKSKKFHRIERKQKMKQQLKEFEELQKTDPEAALAKLELLEKSRAEERMSLRHKSTGQWAKNKQIRAKYDKESRQVLAQQLSISRELTQKIKNNDNDDDDNDDNDNDNDGDDDKEKNKGDKVVQPLSVGDKENPWINSAKVPSEIDEFISGYRKYWDAKNVQEKSKLSKANPKENGQLGIEQKITEPFVVPQMIDPPTTLNPVEEVIVQHPELMFDVDDEGPSENESNDNNEAKGRLTGESGRPIKEYQKIDQKLKQPDKEETNNKNQLTKRMVAKAAGTSTWLITPLVNSEELQNKTNYKKNENIDDIFDTISDKMSEKFCTKLKNLKKNVTQIKKRKTVVERVKKSSTEYVPDLSFKNQKQRPIIDEEMLESTKHNQSDINNEINKLRKLANTATDLGTRPKEVEIDPQKFINMKPKHLKSQVPDIVTGGDEGLDNSEEEEEQDEEVRRDLISEAFADDDVVDEFRQEKEEQIKKSRPEDLDLSLPGWGSWVGKNIMVSSRKKRRFILKFPKDAPRKDKNKGDVIIIEEKNQKIKEHQVNELPFPFNSVKDFEASVRAPIGRTFVPENAHRRLIQPAVKTKLGKIIEPMDQDSLVDTKNMKNDLKRKKVFARKRDKRAKNKSS